MQETESVGARPVVARPRFASGLPRFWRQLRRTRLATFGVIVLLGLLLMAFTADLISPYNPIRQDSQAVLQRPSGQHWFGTDDVGRDILSRVIHGSRVSLEVGFLAVLISAAVGAALGLVSGYGPQWGDMIIMRVTDAVYSFPTLLLALGLTAALGPGLVNIIIAIGVVHIPYFARLTRGQTLSVREYDYVLAARVLGASHVRILGNHIWPNVTAPIIVQGSLTIAFAILVEASLSFLGLGVVPPTPTWGSMLRVGYTYVQTASWLAISPGVAIFVSILGFNLLGDGLRIALDPRLLARGQG